MTFEDFIARYLTLVKSLPKPPTFSTDNENSDYVSYTYRSKNCFYCFDCVECVNCLYCYDSVKSQDCIDCDYCVDSEFLYECVDCYKTHNCAYLDYCARLYDSLYCWDCHDSHDLFGCVHIKQKQYCIFNVQYTKEEYAKRIKELVKLSPQELLEKRNALYKKFPLGPTLVSHSENSDFGNHVHYCSNCYLSFDSARSENCLYSYDSFFSKNSLDITYCYKAELCYECTDSAKIYNCDHVQWSSECFDSSYLTNCKDCHNCFGCVGLTHKRFCILNKEYSEEEYKKIIKEVRPHSVKI